MRFYLGTHMPNWLSKTDVPLFLSARRLRTIKKKFHRARGPWAIDSGGFSEISLFGEWRTSASQYAAEVARWSSHVGVPDWAAIQDWMCEPDMLKRTGKSVADHQELSVASYSDLLSLAPTIRWMPVLQGWHVDDYRRHIDMYRSAGFDDVRFGLGSVCRRQSTDGVGALISDLRRQGLLIHAFGFKRRGLLDSHKSLESSDSLAWSYAARHSQPLAGCSGHKNCANCITYALKWRKSLLEILST